MTIIKTPLGFENALIEILLIRFSNRTCVVIREMVNFQYFLQHRSTRRVLNLNRHVQIMVSTIYAYRVPRVMVFFSYINAMTVKM